MRSAIVVAGLLLTGCAGLNEASEAVCRAVAQDAPVRVELSRDEEGRPVALATGGTPASRVTTLARKASSACARQGLQAAGLRELLPDGSTVPLGTGPANGPDLLRVRFACVPYPAG